MNEIYIDLPDIKLTGTQLFSLLTDFDIDVLHRAALDREKHKTPDNYQELTELDATITQDPEHIFIEQLVEKLSLNQITEMLNSKRKQLRMPPEPDPAKRIARDIENLHPIYIDDINLNLETYQITPKPPKN